MNKNNNIATIYHDRHDQLKLLAGSPAKAEFLSKCIYWWQISKYKIKNSDHIWFTRTTDELAAGAGLSDSSVGRYLRDFANKGLIEKRVIKRYSRKHGQEIACLHIRITEKLLTHLTTNQQKTVLTAGATYTSPKEPTNNSLPTNNLNEKQIIGENSAVQAQETSALPEDISIHSESSLRAPMSVSNQDGMKNNLDGAAPTSEPSTTHQTVRNAERPDGTNLPHIDDTPSVNLTVPTINNKEKDINNSTVSQDNVNYGNKDHTSTEKTIFPIEKEIGERVSKELKNHIKGMLYNVLKQQGLELKNNERLFAEVLFAVTNKEQLKDIDCMNHRVNIVSSLIRKKQWKTPKGFYNHWDIGQAFKERDEVKRRRTSQEKLERELLGVTDPQRIAEIKSRFETSMADESRFDKQKKTIVKQKEQVSHQRLLSEKLNRISNEIFTEGKYLKQMEDAYQQGLGYASQELIDSIGIKIARLYDEQARIESELQDIRQDWELCA